MTRRVLPRLLPPFALMFVALVCVSQPASVHGQSLRTVLTVQWSSEDFPGSAEREAAIRKVLLSRADMPIDYYAEYLESDRFPEEDASLALRDYIGRKYRGRRIDVVIAISDVALQFVLRHRGELFPNAPIVFSGVAAPDASIRNASGGITGVLLGPGYADTLELALKVHPSTERVLVVAQTPNRMLEDVVRPALEAFGRRIEITYIAERERSLAGLIDAIKAASPRSLIFYIRFSQEDPGNVLFPTEIAALVAQASPVPVYVDSDLIIGSGAVGGVVHATQAIATRVGEMARQILEGTRAQDIPYERATRVPTFDWRQLQRWRISETLLPAGSIVRFRQPSAWSRYKLYIIGALAIVALQSAMIVGLVVQRARQRRTELALRESEQHFRVMADTAPVLIWRSGIDKARDFVNKPWLDFSGRTQEEECGSGWAQGVHPDDLDECLRVYGSAFDARAPFEMEYRLRRADGEFRWVLDTGVPRYDEDAHFAGYIGSALDITERKRAEQQNRDFAGRLINAEEAERARIGRELHDDVCQRLAVLAIMLSGLKQGLSGSTPQPDLEEALTTLQERISTLASDVRNLSHDLHPSVLGHAGLVPVLKAHCDEFALQQKLDVTFRADEGAGAVDDNAALCIYRVTQEALTNAGKHSGASTVRVQLTRSAEAIELEVIDNGIGFVPSEDTGGLGLRNIAERVRLIRGSVSVESQLGCGTNLRVRIPCAVQEFAGGSRPLTRTARAGRG